MILIVGFDIGVDIIDVPEFIINDLDHHSKKFSSWISCKESEHSYWMSDNSGNIGLCYRSEAFVEWLNLFPLSNSKEKARIIASNVYDYNKKLPSVFY